MDNSRPLNTKQQADSESPSRQLTKAQKDLLVTQNVGYVVTMAKQYAGRGVDFDDLVSEGNMAMTIAAAKYDPTRGNRFVSYAAPVIRHAMEEAIERQAGLYRIPRNDASREEKKRKMPLSVDEPIPVGAKTNFNLLSVLQDLNAQPTDGNMESREQLQRVRKALDTLDEREREVMKRYLGLDGEHLTMAQIGETMGLKRERIRQIRDKAIRKLRRIFS